MWFDKLFGRSKAEAKLVETGPDGMEIREDTPYREAQILLSQLFRTIPDPAKYCHVDAEGQEVTHLVLSSEPQKQVEMVCAILPRMVWLSTLGRTGDATWWNFVKMSRSLLSLLLRRNLPYDGHALEDMLCAISIKHELSENDLPYSSILKICEEFKLKEPLPEPICNALERLKPRLNRRYDSGQLRKLRFRIDHLLGIVEPADLESRDEWAAAVMHSLEHMDATKANAWNALITYSRTASQSKPSQKWLNQAKSLVTAIGEAEFKTRILEWFPLVKAAAPAGLFYTPTHLPLSERNSEVLKGMVWTCSVVEDEKLTSAVGDLAQACFKKIPEFGPVSAKVGNACLCALQKTPGTNAILQLSRLKLKVKYAAAQRIIHRALEEAAAERGLSSEELEEMVVPSYGLNENGVLLEDFGHFTAKVEIVGTTDLELTWQKANDKTQKSIPVEVKDNFPDDLKELKRTIQDIEKMLPAQRDRLECSLSSEREWLLAQWRERYLNQPLLAHMARRLIWHFRLGDRTALGIWIDGKLVDIQDQPLDWLAPETRVRFWHPIGFPVETVSAWRRWLETRPVVQPFKQAHREIYVLTDAELNTNTYSNRFAGHIIKQHQFAALAKQRGWKYSLQGDFDSHNTPTLLLPRWNLSVEFWVDGAGNDRSSTGICLYLSTDQVRFCREGHPIQLHEVPALAFTEAMRDIDLFVGVCSVGNDPAWHDRGEDMLHQTYWNSFSFGELSAAAKTRKEILERLLPKLKIADRCSFDEKSLVVRGDCRTYKIHLGSANILMEPNNQYLCIVPDRASSGKVGDKVFLPFEGDNTMAVILSKAFLLAADSKIKDPGIVSQINRAS